MQLIDFDRIFKVQTTRPMHLSVCLSPLPTYNRQTFNNWTLDAIISAVNYKHCDRLSQNSSIFGKITQWCVIICVSLFLNRLHHMHRIHVAYFYRCRMFRGLCRSVCSTQCLVSSTKGINRSRCRFWGRDTRVGSRNHGVQIDATWRIRLNDPCAAAKRPCVKLLWKLEHFQWAF